MTFGANYDRKNGLGRLAKTRYGVGVAGSLSKELNAEFAKGFSKRNFELIRKSYLAYRNTKSPISQCISWTHNLRLMRIENEEERRFYEIEIESNNWSMRERSRQINSSLYERLILSKNKSDVLKLPPQGIKRDIVHLSSDFWHKMRS